MRHVLAHILPEEIARGVPLAMASTNRHRVHQS